MKLKERWERTRIPIWDDYFRRVPWWLRVKRFVSKQRTETQYQRDTWDTYLDDMYDPPEEL